MSKERGGVNSGTMWNDLVSVKKGCVGERLVNQYLIEQGFIPYSPDTDGAHPFDRLVATRDKRHIFIADVKTKPARTFYPDTGINIAHYNQYDFIQKRHKVNTFIFFVDEDAGKVYGNWLRKLARERWVSHKRGTNYYPKEDGGIIYFPLAVMKHICDIPAEAISELKKFSRRKAEYATVTA